MVTCFVQFLLLAFIGLLTTLEAFELANFFQIPAFVQKKVESIDTVKEIKNDLLQAVSLTGNGKNATPERQQKVLDMVGRLETLAPTSPTLLFNPEEAKALDGVWFLQYTSPSVVGDADQFPNAWKPKTPMDEKEQKIETVPFQAKGTVSAVGITVDTSNRVVKQCFDISTSTVTNDVTLDFGRVCVVGRFRPSQSVPNRAIVAFESCLITWNKLDITIDLSFVFQILAIFRGTKDSGWLETTYLDQDLRIGRGNKGTMFVLTRDFDAVEP